MFITIDLFAGAGGLSLGFMQTKKYDIKVAYEFNPAMQETYKKNHPGVDVFGDVRDADYSMIREKYGEIDVVIGGPPCQGFSNANRQKNHAISQNNSLVKQYIRAILELKPKAFVMENVSMLRSDVHRFYLCKDDQELVDGGKIETSNTELVLLEEKFVFDGAIEVVKSKEIVKEYKWDDIDYLELNVIYKASRNKNKFKGVLEKHKGRIIKITKKHVCLEKGDTILSADYEAFRAMLAYYEGNIEESEIRTLIEPAIMYQRMISKAEEIFDNDLIVDSYNDKKGLIVNIRSYAVFDYLKAKLCDDSEKDSYVISADVLSATQFGVPQKRMRFVVMGIRKSITDKVKFPDGKFKAGPFRTVEDAIKDLEDVEPVFNVSDDKYGIKLCKKTGLSDLAQSLRNTNILHNHIVTKTTDVAMERFMALEQGQNFHSLSDELKTNTYTDVSRTQNTIYLRLKYNEPSGTVVNVRKSMWVHPTKNRAISIREAARLQTFPDSFVFCGTKDKQYQQVGNAVPPIMAKAIAKKLAIQLIKALDTQAKEDS